MKTLTIFTPTYNRVDTLKKAYKSLIEQVNKDFVWLIIDDGSTDNTYEVVQEWQRDNKIEIRYYKKENGGKHTAYNLAVDICDTKLVMVSLDSDDYLKKDAVDIILTEWRKAKSYNNKIVGIATFCERENGDIIIYKNKVKLDICSLKDAFCNNYINCSAIFTFETNYIKNYKFPIIENEKFFTEAYIFMQMREPIKWIYKGVCVREFRNDGLTKNTNKLFLYNPSSWCLYNKLRMKYNNHFLYKIKYTIYYIAFSILSKNKNSFKDASYKFLYILLFPLGLLGSFYIKIKGVER